MDVPSAVVDSTAWSASHRRPIEPESAPPVPLETEAEVAARLKVSPRRVRHLAATGQLPHIRISERQLRFDRGAIDAWIASRAQGGEQ